MKHQILRIRHDVLRRILTVRRTEQVTPAMLRLWLEGEDLAGFTSAGADDHIKLFVGKSGESREMRDYTPRRYDPDAGELAIDFALHDAGPATQWARTARPGDTVKIGGPRGSIVVSCDFDWWLLIGDETALPAIGRRVEELPAGATVTTLIAVTGPEEEQKFVTPATYEAFWIHRSLDRADDPTPLLEALRKFSLPVGDGFIWVAAEAKVARAVREHLLSERKHPAEWLRASGYWVKGQADAREKFG